MTRAPVQTYNEKFTVSLQKVDGSPPPTLKQSERSGVAWRRYPRGMVRILQAQPRQSCDPAWSDSGR